VCDNTPMSPFYGNCYTQFDDFGNHDRIKISTSTDGGLTWGAAMNTANNAASLGGQPVVQPNCATATPYCDQAIYTTTSGLGVAAQASVARPVDRQPVANAASDHAAPQAALPRR
jgi:hypothetical protein